MTADNYRPRTSAIHHRLTLIVYDRALGAAREALRCAAYDAGVQLFDRFEQQLGTPPVKWMLGTDFVAPLKTATRLIQNLPLCLKEWPAVLLRLEVLGGGLRDRPPVGTGSADLAQALARLEAGV